MEHLSGAKSKLTLRTDYYFSMCACLVAQLCLTFCDLWTAAHQVPHPWDISGKNTRVGSHSLLQGVFLEKMSSK